MKFDIDPSTLRNGWQFLEMAIQFIGMRELILLMRKCIVSRCLAVQDHDGLDVLKIA